MSWAGPVSLLPAVGSVVAVIGFYSKKPNVMRYISFLAQGLSILQYKVQYSRRRELK